MEDGEIQTTKLVGRKMVKKPKRIRLAEEKGKAGGTQDDVRVEGVESCEGGSGLALQGFAARTRRGDWNERSRQDNRESGR